LELRHVASREDDPFRVRDFQACRQPAQRSFVIDRIPSEDHGHIGRHRRLRCVGREDDHHSVAGLEQA
jgi:hypothetical protein